MPLKTKLEKIMILTQIKTKFRKQLKKYELLSLKLKRVLFRVPFIWLPQIKTKFRKQLKKYDLLSLEFKSLLSRVPLIWLSGCQKRTLIRERFIESCYHLTSKKYFLGSLSFDYLVVKPLPEVEMDFSVTYRWRTNPKIFR